MKRFIWPALFVTVVLLAVGGLAFFRPGIPIPGVGCGSCHESVVLSGSHASFAAQCQLCHLGDVKASEEEAAHVGMEIESGALETAGQTCGKCHPEELARVASSLMATGRGIVAVDRWAFGELETPDGAETLQEVLATEDPTPAQHHLRKLCSGCHLGTRRDNRDDVVDLAGSGCSACHLASGLQGEDHPDVRLEVPDDRCFGCHSRSGRISLSYAGLAEVSECDDPTVLADGREVCARPADVHATAGLACIDCHLHTETMGDGAEHQHKEQAVEVRCESCHGPDAPEKTWLQATDRISTALSRMRGAGHKADETVRTGSRGTPLVNLRKTENGWRLTSKLGARSWLVPQTPTDADHTLVGHERLACATCHAVWAPRCPSCHTRLEEGEQWDFAAAAETAGRWVEEGDPLETAPPALAVAGDQIRPAIPGMIGSLETPEGRHELNYFATLDPHTTGGARTCDSCHGDTSAWELGIGTRTDSRSLTAEERSRVGRVSQCRACHESAADAVYADFSASVGTQPARCKGPRLR